MDDDVTIEDELEFEQEPSSQPKSATGLLQWSNIFQLLSQQWTLFILLSIAIAVFLYINQRRRRGLTIPGIRIQGGQNVPYDPVDRYDEIERVRQRQQKAYEEQALINAELKKAKLESLKATTIETGKPLKYRSHDHNPLTGQSTRGEGDSCSWRPSSRRKAGGGGG